MTLIFILMLVYYYFLAAVHGAANPGPAPTRPARLDKRQSQGFLGAATIWSPSFGPGSSTIGYGPLYQFGITVTTLGNFWNFCSLSRSCTFIATSCQSGTLFPVGGSTSYICAATVPVCGVNYLFSTPGAQLELTRSACFSTAIPKSNTFFLVSPTISITITSLTESSTSTSTPSQVTIVVFPTGTPAPAPAPASTQVGGIVGGVVGGLVVLALAAAVISCILRRRSRRLRFAQPASGAAEIWLGT